MFLFTLISIFIGSFSSVDAPATMTTQPFITTWNTKNPGSCDACVVIPTNPNLVYDYDVKWGDGTVSSGLTGDASHTYGQPGTYTIEISGTFPAIQMGGAQDNEKIVSIDQWGDINWKSMFRAFQGLSLIHI